MRLHFENWTFVAGVTAPVWLPSLLGFGATPLLVTTPPWCAPAGAGGLLCLVLMGMLPVLLWTLGIWIFDRREVLAPVWAHTLKEFRPWMDLTIRVRERCSPVRWAKDSADEKLLREGMLDSFTYGRGNARDWHIPRVLWYFTAPVYLGLLGILAQALWLKLWPPGFPRGGLSLALILWGILAYGYLYLQRGRGP